jgi:hypothetical protein
MWCGYDIKMRSGVEEFGQGVYASMRAKAAELGVPLSVQVSTEQDQLFALERYLEGVLATTSMSEEARLRARAFLGLVMLTRFLIGDAPQDTDVEILFETMLRDRGNQVTDLIRAFDQCYEAVKPSFASHVYKVGEAAKGAHLFEDCCYAENE